MKQPWLVQRGHKCKEKPTYTASSQEPWTPGASTGRPARKGGRNVPGPRKTDALPPVQRKELCTGLQCRDFLLLSRSLMSHEVEDISGRDQDSGEIECFGANSSTKTGNFPAGRDEPAFSRAKREPREHPGTWNRAGLATQSCRGVRHRIRYTELGRYTHVGL